MGSLYWRRNSKSTEKVQVPGSDRFRAKPELGKFSREMVFLTIEKVLGKHSNP
jgi:hypothetical protein